MSQKELQPIPAYDVRGGSGLGDAIYINSISQELLKTHPNIVLRTKYAGVFRFLPIETKYFSKGGEHLAFNYGGGARKRQNTTLYQDLLLDCKLDPALTMNTKWEWVQSSLCDKVVEQKKDKKLLVFTAAHRPFGRDDGRGDAMIPNWNKFNCLLNYAKDNGYYIVQVGRGEVMHKYRQVDYDITNNTSISDIMNLGMVADLGIGQCGFIIPLMEGFKKPYYIILAQKGIDAKHDFFISCLTLEKLFARKDVPCGGAMDSWADERIVGDFVNVCKL